jgi:lipopolysaccharide exporter
MQSDNGDVRESAPTFASGQASAPAAEAPLAFRVVRGGFWVAASSYFNIGFGFLANLVLTRLLAPEAFGAFALGMFFFSLFNLRTKTAVGQAFAQRPETTGELIGTHLALDMATGLASFVLALIAAPLLLALGFTHPVVWVMLALAAVGVSQSVMGTAWVLLDKELMFGWVSLVTTVAFPLSYVPAIVLALRGGGYWSLVAQNAVYAILLLVGLWWVCRRYLPQVWHMRWRFNRVVAKEFIRFGAMVGLAALAGTLTLQFDNFLVGSLVSLETLGFYDRAYRIAQWPTLLVSNVATRTAFYAYAKLQNDQVRLTKAVTMSFWLITILALPLALVIFASAPDLVTVLYGERWQPSALFVRFLVVYSLLRPLLNNASSLLVAVGQPQRKTIIWAVQALVLLIAATPLTLTYGAVGTCIGVGIAFMVGLALAYRYIRQVVDLSMRDVFAVPGGAAVLALVAYVLLARSVDLTVLPLGMQVVLQAGFVAGIFFAALLAIQPRRLIERSAYVWRLIRASG